MSLLELRNDILLLDSRPTVPRMAQLAKRHPRLNLLNLEAVAVGQLPGATVRRSAEAAAGAIQAALDQEHVAWQTVTIPKG